jgi:hypothetical protein
VQGHSALDRRVGDGFVTRVAWIGVYPADGGDRVLAGPQDCDDLLVVGDQRAVHHAVGVQRQHLVDAGAGGHAQRSGAEDLADVASVLVRTVHPTPDQLELRVIRHAFDGGLANPSGRPLNDTKLGRTTHW